MLRITSRVKSTAGLSRHRGLGLGSSPGEGRLLGNQTYWLRLWKSNRVR